MAADTNPITMSTLIGACFAGAALLVLNLAVTLSVLDLYGLLQNREIVSINAADMVMGFVAAQDATISEEELQLRVRALNQNLDQVIGAFAQERNVIVVNSAAVLGGTRDVTGDVLAHLGVVQ